MQYISSFLLKISIFTIMIFSLSCSSSEPALATQANALEADNNKTDFFPIGVYYVAGQKTIQSDTDDPNDPDYVPLENDFRYNPVTAENEYLQEFQDLKSYGFNTAILIINPLVHPSAEENKTRALGVVNGLITAAEKAKLQIVVPVNKTTSLLSTKDENLSIQDIENALLSDYINLFVDSNATLGYQIFDEPVPFGEGGNYGPFEKEVIEEQLALVNNSILELDNNAFALSTWNNINSMELLNNAMNPDALLMDIYPFAVDAYNGDQADSDTPYGDLSDAFPRGRADDGSFNLGEDQPSFSESITYAQNIAKDKPVWVALQAFGGDTYWRKPAPKELRLQAFTAIKNGAKGLFYFLYQSESWIDGMMDINYQETPLILEAKEINKKVNALAPTLLRVTKDPNHASSMQADIETFTHKNGEKYLIALNRDINNTTTVTISIDKSWLGNLKKATDIYTDENFTIDSENRLILQIEAADARVILLKK
jgi:hypothetical protein